MGAKFSKGGKVKQNGTDAALDESLDTFNKTSTLPASFRKKDDEVTKSGTLPRGGANLDRSTSFSKRFRKSVTKLVGQKEVIENASESQGPTEPSSVVLGQEECNGKLKDVAEEEVDSKQETPRREVREVDSKTAQKRARAQFFQELYTSKEQAHIPKPPRSRNIPSPLQKVDVDADLIVPAAIGTPVVKLIEKHEEAIEKQQEHNETNNSINSQESEIRENEKKMEDSDVSFEVINKDDAVCVSDKQVEEIKQEEVSVVREEITLREETILKEDISMTQSVTAEASHDTRFEQEHSAVNFEENVSSYETESINVTSLSSETVETFSNVEITKEQIGDAVCASFQQVEEIKQEEESVVTEEITLKEETVLKEEISMTQSMTMAASNDTRIEQENSTVNFEENISCYETESIDVTSLSSENVETFSNVDNTKEQAGDASNDATNDSNEGLLNEEAVIETNDSDDNGWNEPEVNVELERKFEIELNETEKIVENSEDIENKSEHETEMTKDNGDHAAYDSCQVNKEILSQDMEEKMIDPITSCNSQQEIRDEDFTKPDSLESINQNDEINPTVTEKEEIIESTGTGKSDLVNDTVIVDSGANGLRDVLRLGEGSEGGFSTDEKSDLVNDSVSVDSGAKGLRDVLRFEEGSEGGCSTDEGIAASDDEENKHDFHKVDNLEAKENKSSEQMSEQNEPENML
eukprot:GFUD01000970.1.p1 GENE.GFUD01000970.1~~GFUD01000970.1.p1  ORF type:complete len:697 (+),score=241.88 GFUD01000970.1:190-2280(+)